MSSKYITHHAYCLKNVIKCRCGKFIDKSDQEAHNKEYHENVSQWLLVNCKYCGAIKEKMDLSAHEVVCSSRPKKCPICSLELEEGEYKAHVNNCGGKTDQCPICNKTVLMKDMETHIIQCQIKLDQSQNRPSKIAVPKSNAKKKASKGNRLIYSQIAN